jgi:hypothetical protein
MAAAAAAAGAPHLVDQSVRLEQRLVRVHKVEDGTERRGGGVAHEQRTTTTHLIVGLAPTLARVPVSIRDRPIAVWTLQELRIEHRLEVLTASNQDEPVRADQLPLDVEREVRILPGRK